MRPVDFEDVGADGNFSLVYTLTIPCIAEEDNDDEYGEVPDRETLKKQTMQLINARLKSKQPKKTKKKRGQEKTAADDDE